MRGERVDSCLRAKESKRRKKAFYNMPLVAVVAVATGSVFMSRRAQGWVPRVGIDSV